MASRFAEREDLLAVCPTHLDRPMYQQFLSWLRQDQQGQEVAPHNQTPAQSIQAGFLDPDISTPSSTPTATPLSSLSPTPMGTPNIATITLPGSSSSNRLKSDATLTPTSHPTSHRFQLPDAKTDIVKGKGDETVDGVAADSEAIEEEAETPRAIEAIEQALDVFRKREEFNQLAGAIETRRALKSALNGRLVIETIGVDGIIVRKVIDHIKGKYSVDEIVRMSESENGEGIKEAIRDAYEVVNTQPR